MKYNRLSLVQPEELPDTRLPKSQRQELKVLAEEYADLLGVDALMFLAGALEDEARKKRSKS